MSWDDDWRFSEEARDRDYQIIWQCDRCGARREDYPGYNEGGTCDFCRSGQWVESGETYNA